MSYRWMTRSAQLFGVRRADSSARTYACCRRMSAPTTTMPVSELVGLVDMAGSTATTMRDMGGWLLSRAFSIHSLFQRASSSSSISSACISCCPRRVPSYWSIIPLKKAGGRLSWFSYVEPRVTCTPGLLGRLRTSSMFLGVVVTTERGCCPRR